MKDISSKTDNTSSLPAAAFNSMVSEMENAVTDAGFTLDNGSETAADPNPTQISAAIGAAGRDADAFTDSGSANAYTLTKIRGKAETVYRNGAKFRFVPANTNTGASTVNIQSIGSKNIRFGDNSALTAGAIQANTVCEIYYDSAADNFKLLVPPTASGSSPGLYKAGSAPGVTGGASIGSGYVGEIKQCIGSSSKNLVVGAYEIFSTDTTGGVAGGVALTAGRWELSFHGFISGSNAANYYIVLISTSNGDNTTGSTAGVNYLEFMHITPVSGVIQSFSMTGIIVDLSGNQDYYGKVNQNGGTFNSVRGLLTARRIG